MNNRLTLTWQDVQYLVQTIARQLHNDDWRPDIIVGVGRGGLVPSVMLSHYLNVPHDSVKVSLRDNNNNNESLLWAPSDVIDGKKILILDDINDSGETQRWIREDWAGSVAGADPYFAENFWHDSVRWASLINNDASKEISDYSGQSINKLENNVWVDFPWESWWNRSTL